MISMADEKTEVKTKVAANPERPKTTANVEKPKPVQKFTDKNPVHWNVERLNDKRIKASNSFSGETFEGTMSEYKKRF